MTETPRDNEEANATNPVGKIEKFISKHFIWLLVGLAVSGGALAIFGPWLLYVKGWTGETDANLRLHILYVTGGTIAVLGLIETHRKNTTDRIKADADIQNYQASQDHQAKTLNEQARQFTETIAKEREKIEADKAKNEQDHIRQVHAERRSRYSTAVEQLSNDKASIRLGGVYALIGLADEWLADEYRLRQEGQIIINNLCAYIRSPFDLAYKHEELSQDQVPKDYKGGAEKFNEDRGRFREEKDIRLAILDAINTRRDFIIIFKDRSQVIRKGSWSYLDYDFSNAYFFYDVNFNYIYFGASSNFSGAIFTQDANFSGAIFTEGVDFSGTTFHKEPIFINELDYARFSYRIDPEDYNFEVSHNSPYKLETEEQEHNGVKFIIPKGTELFDPGEPSKSEQAALSI